MKKLFADFLLLFNVKSRNELRYWRDRFAAENQNFGNCWYQTIMLALTGKTDDAFLNDKVVVDFGCGPRGSLAWTHAPQRRIGLDVLMPYYLLFFGSCMNKHGVEYIACSEEKLPLETQSVDICLQLIHSIT